MYAYVLLIHASRTLAHTINNIWAALKLIVSERHIMLLQEQGSLHLFPTDFGLPTVVI